MEIEEKTKTEIYKTTGEMVLKIQYALKEIDNAKDDLQKLRDKENLNTYYTWTIDERLNEAKMRLSMSLTRIDEFRSEADSLNLSTDGFY